MVTSTNELLLSTGADPVDLVAERFRAWVRGYPVKTLMALAGCEEKTAARWQSLGERPVVPQNRHFSPLVRAWGGPFLDYVYAPVLPDPGLDRRLADAMGLIESVREELSHGYAPEVAPVSGAVDGTAACAGGRGAGATGRRASAARAGVAAARGVVVALVLLSGVGLPTARDAWAGVHIAADDWVRVPRGGVRRAAGTARPGKHERDGQ